MTTICNQTIQRVVRTSHFLTKGNNYSTDAFEGRLVSDDIGKAGLCPELYPYTDNSGEWTIVWELKNLGPIAYFGFTGTTNRFFSKGQGYPCIVNNGVIFGRNGMKVKSGKPSPLKWKQIYPRNSVSSPDPWGEQATVPKTDLNYEKGKTTMENCRDESYDTNELNIENVDLINGVRVTELTADQLLYNITQETTKRDRLQDITIESKRLTKMIKQCTDNITKLTKFLDKAD